MSHPPIEHTPLAGTLHRIQRLTTDLTAEATAASYTDEQRRLLSANALKLAAATGCLPKLVALLDQLIPAHHVWTVQPSEDRCVRLIGIVDDLTARLQGMRADAVQSLWRADRDRCTAADRNRWSR